MHFGFEASGDKRIGKCYLELPALAATASGMQFLGFKWSMGKLRLAVVSRYLAVAADSIPQIHDLLLSNIAGWESAAAGLLDRVLGLNPGDLTAGPTVSDFRLLKVTEEGSDRLSYDLNTYECELDISAIADHLATISQNWNCPRHEFQAWRQQFDTATLGHLALGQNRSGEPFVTIYHQS